MGSGRIINRENIGKTSQELVQLWNEEHPEDPITLGQESPPSVSDGLRASWHLHCLPDKNGPDAGGIARTAEGLRGRKVRVDLGVTPYLHRGRFPIVRLAFPL